MKLTHLFSAILIAVVIFPGCEIESEHSDYSPLDSLIEETAATYISENNINGIAVGFVDASNYRIEKGFGGVDATSFFPMASVTKVITAAAIMQLVQSGDLDLNSKLSDCLPGFELKNPYPNSPEITIRHILTHTSGLSRDIMSLAQGYCPAEKNEILDYINNHRQIMPAGYRHSYSNPGFELMALVVENLSGLSYPSYIRKNIFEPLNMEKSFFDQKAEGVYINRSYTMFSSEVYDEMPINYLAAGGLKSNVHEMLNFTEMLLQQKTNNGTMLLGEKYLQKMFSQQNTGVLLDTDIMMGVSVFLEELPEPLNRKLVYHGGGALFTNNMLLLAPDYGLGVVVFCNTAGSYQMVEQLARSIIYKALEIKTGHELIAPQHTTPEELNWPVAERRKICGNYFTSNNLIKIKEVEDSIIAEAGNNRFPVKYYEDGLFSYYEGYYLKVEEIEEERILFLLSNGVLTPIGKHNDISKQSIPLSWEKASGTYSVVNPCREGAVNFYESLHVYKRNNNLYVGMLPEKIVRDTYGINSEIPAIIIPLNDTVAIMQNFGRYSAEPLLLSIDDDAITFSGLKFKKDK